MEKVHLAIDLGTTNTVVARWNDEHDCPEILQIDDICRNTRKKNEVDDSYTIPSCIFIQQPEKVYRFPLNLLFRNFKSRTRGLAGMEALLTDSGRYKNNFVDNFKSSLGKNSYRILAKVGKWSYNSGDVARIFLSAVFDKIRLTKKIKPASVTYCVPVDFYEFYRANLKKISSQIKIHRIKTIDEPVAAAIGYGLNIEESRNILVFDFGGGTLDIALISTGEKSRRTGKCSVVVKDGAPIGGNLIDSWIVEDLCHKYKYNFEMFMNDPNIQWWYKVLKNEARVLKESLFLQTAITFYLMPAAIMDKYSMKIPGQTEMHKKPIDYTRSDLVRVLTEKKLYNMINRLINSVLEEAEEKGYSKNDIDDVLMVGGSTLLPKVYALVEKKFGRDRVRAWQPFNAVAFGAAAFAAKKINKSDYITHDYAFVTYDKETHEKEYTVIIPKKTQFPTVEDFWKRQLVPTCALGEPENIFKLVICEIGKRHSISQEFVWDEKGELHSLDEGDDARIVIPLNETDPTLGYLNPPHYPSEKNARIEVSFMINEDKWLCSTVVDLKTQKKILDCKPVIRLK
ncbi:MAG: Hsp70 family protein [Spirochaetes bacterium]|nr:Hsp70 family protein [Spirochaetota bacterium]